jgi:hypothetical protein
MDPQLAMDRRLAMLRDQIDSLYPGDPPPRPLRVQQQALVIDLVEGERANHPPNTAAATTTTTTTTTMTATGGGGGGGGAGGGAVNRMTSGAVREIRQTTLSAGTALVRDEALADDVECSICLNPFFSTDKVFSLPCKHVFHPKCLEGWIVKDNSCPECRTKLPVQAAVVIEID